MTCAGAVRRLHPDIAEAVAAGLDTHHPARPAAGDRDQRPFRRAGEPAGQRAVVDGRLAPIWSIWLD